MPIPDYQTLMKPFLLKLADGNPHTMKELAEQLADYFHLTEDERVKTIPSGMQPLFYNHVGWARTYLKKAGLIESPRRGVVRITDRGKAIIHEDPESIDNKFLMRFEEFRSYYERGVRTLKEYRESVRRSGASENSISSGPEPNALIDTPEEAIAKALAELNEAVLYDLREKLRTLSPHVFERLVLDVLLKMGYGGSQLDAGKLTGGSGDEGIDGLIRQDPLGLDSIYLQAKHWSQPVGRPEIQRFVGALQGKRARRGVFITSSEFTKEAREYADHLEPKVVLIDGSDLARLMFDYGVGVSAIRTIEIKRIDSDYFAVLMGEGD